MKHAHQRDLERAERKAVMNEERSASLRGQQETRVANLESRLQELSETVGSYDRLRQQDQNAMQKLRERITQLDLENQSLQKTHKNPSYQGILKKNIQPVPFHYIFCFSIHRKSRWR